MSSLPLRDSSNPHLHLGTHLSDVKINFSLPRKELISQKRKKDLIDEIARVISDDLEPFASGRRLAGERQRNLAPLMKSSTLAIEGKKLICTSTYPRRTRPPRMRRAVVKAIDDIR